MFTEVCFIRKNTESLVNKLINMGYKCLNSGNTTIDAHNYNRHGDHKNVREGTAIITSHSGYFGIVFNIDNITKKDRIDCDVDEELFLAIAAINDENDKNQWFVNSDYSCWVFCDKDSFEYDFELYPAIKCLITKSAFHKATADELVNMF